MKPPACVLTPLLALCLIPASASARDDGGVAETVLFEDPFTEGLADGWSWVREESSARRLEGGVLRLHPLPGTLWERDNAGKNLLVRPAPEVGAGGALAVEVTVGDASEGAEAGADTAPGLYEQVGLVWYRDDDNYVKFVKEFYDGRWWVVLASEREGKAEYAQFKLDSEAASGPVRLRLTVEGGKAAGAFRPAGAGEPDPWQPIGRSFDLPTQGGDGDARVGLLAHGSVDDPARWAGFDDFAVKRVRPAQRGGG